MHARFGFALAVRMNCKETEPQVSLREFQSALGRLVRAAAGTPNGIAENATSQLCGLDLTPEERASIARLVTSPGFRFTLEVQRSWCEGRAASAARLTLSIIPSRQRHRLVQEWIEKGGGTASLVTSEAEEFLEFIACHLEDPSHALTLCRMEQAVYRASQLQGTFMPLELSTLSDPEVELCAGRHGMMVLFFAEPQRLLAAVNRGLPLPQLTMRPYPVLFAPGLPSLFRPATFEELALWEALSQPVTLRALLDQQHARETIETLAAVGAATTVRAIKGDRAQAYL